MDCTVIKKSAAVAAQPARKAAVGTPATKAAVAFQIVDNQDDTFTVQGVDVSGAPVDISNVATLKADSSDQALMTVDPPVGMVVKAHALAPGSVTLTFLATWNTGIVGPFTVTLPVTITGGPAVGLTVTPGTPTVR